MPVTLRPYQTDDIERLRAAYSEGSDAVLYQLPTGGGKTIVFCHVIEGAVGRGNRTLVLSHRRELIRQTSGKLGLVGVPHGIMAATMDRDHDAMVQVASVQSLARRISRLPLFDLIVIDEAHHAIAATWKALIESQPLAKLLGVTATPQRLDGKGLGKDCGGFFDALVCGPSMRTLIDQGYLAEPHVYIPKAKIDTTGVRTIAGDFDEHELAERAQEVTGDAVREYGKLPPWPPTPAMAFCVTVAHAQSVAARFRISGHRAACIHGKMPKDDRDGIIAGFASGAIQVLTSCEIISEGLDMPETGVVFGLRPTKSLTLYLQQIGRGMRPKGGKPLLVFDHAQNCKVHGLPDADREWTLDGAEPGRTPGWTCPECGRFNRPAALACAGCGWTKPVEEEKDPAPRDIPQPDDAEMVRVQPQALVPVQPQLMVPVGLSYRRFLAKRRTEAELRTYAQYHGYKPGWVYYRLREQEELFGRGG